jgi:hypothetical protein
MSEANPRSESLFWSALAIPSPEERGRYLDQSCGGDQQLRGRVEELLAAYPKVEGFLEPPAPGPVATVDDQPASDGPGALVGPYKLIGQIGEGGMGTVWMAQQQEPVKRLVAVKLIKAGMGSKQPADQAISSPSTRRLCSPCRACGRRCSARSGEGNMAIRPPGAYTRAP